MRLRAGLCAGLTAEAVRLLSATGVRTVVDLVSSDLEETAQKCALSYKALVAVRRVLLAQFSAFPVSGADLYEELKTTTAILSTGIQSLDKLLDSGLYTGELTELVGAPGTGKTQVCLSIAACAAQFLKQSVLYVDSTGGVTATRLLQLLQHRTEDKQGQAEALQRIQVVRVFDAYRLLDVLQEYRISVAQQITCATPPAKVVLVDSIAAVLCPLLGRRQPDGMALMMQVAWELKAIAREFGVAVVLTNHVTRDTSDGSLKPALGRSWSFVPSTRVLLQDSKGSSGKATAGRIASLMKSPRQPTETEVELDLGNGELAESSLASPGE